MYRWFLALRWLATRPINLLGILGVAIGTWALIVVVSIFSGYIREVRAHIRATTADISISNLPTDCPFADVERVLAGDPAVAACAPRVVWAGLLHPLAGSRPKAAVVDRETGEDSRFVHLIGIDPERELQASALGSWLDAPADPQLRAPRQGLLQPTADGTPTVLLGVRRTEIEGVMPGDRLRLTCARLVDDGEQSLQTADLDLVLQGGYATPFVLFDHLYAQVHADTLRKMLSLRNPDACNVVAVRVHEGSDMVATARRLERLLRREIPAPLHVETWEETNATFLMSIDHQRSLMKLVLFVIMVVAAFLMFATLSMMVTEKTHDIGILAAMGANRAGILQVFQSCGLAIAVIGAVVGATTGCVSAMLLDDFNSAMREWFGVDLFPTAVYNLDHVPYELDPAWIAQVLVMAIATGMVVSGVPAWRASQHDPVQSLRAE